MTFEGETPLTDASEFEPARRLRGIHKSMIRQVFDRALPGSVNLGLGEEELRETFERVLERIMQSRAAETVGARRG